MATVNDPVCGMTIESESAKARREVDGSTYYFCSSECVAKFDAAPEKYRTTASESAAPEEQLEQHEPPYTTMGFLTSPKFGAAGSGGLEYERLPEAHDTDRT